MLNEKLLEVIACPKCKSDIKERGMFLACRKCGLAFPVMENSIPNMIIEEAWPLKKAEKVKFKHELSL